MKKRNNTINLALFQEFALKNPALLFPAFQLQSQVRGNGCPCRVIGITVMQMRAKILGTAFWERIERKRKDLMGNRDDLKAYIRMINRTAFDDLVGTGAYVLPPSYTNFGQAKLFLTSLFSFSQVLDGRT